MTTPIRIQRRRTKGWRLPANTVCVSRPSKFGNPFGHMPSEPSVVLFRYYLLDAQAPGPRIAWVRDHIRELRGFNLACWCPLDGPCHADVLLELANREETTP